MTNSLLDFLENERLNSKKLHRFRTPKGCSESLINFSGNDYLGLSKNEDVVKSGMLAAMEFGSGGQSSRLVSGTSPLHTELEEKLADWLEYESALVFSSGYQLNTSVLKTLGDNQTQFFIDKLAHNSLLSGALDSKAQVYRFRHNDTHHLEHLLKQTPFSSSSKRWIIVESIYSMDGDEAPLEAIKNLADEYQCNLYVDEAHAIGITGQQGRGLSISIKPEVYVGTFGKAFGTNGAFIASSEVLISYLINKAGGFIYSTALSPFTVGATLKALEIIQSADVLRADLQKKSNQLREKIENRKGLPSTRSCIIPWIVGSEEDALSAHDFLLEHGFYAPAIRPPTVPNGTSRIRFCLSSAITSIQLEQVTELVQQWQQ